MEHSIDLEWNVVPVVETPMPMDGFPCYKPYWVVIWGSFPVVLSCRWCIRRDGGEKIMIGNIYAKRRTVLLDWAHKTL